MFARQQQQDDNDDDDDTTDEVIDEIVSDVLASSSSSSSSDKENNNDDQIRSTGTPGSLGINIGKELGMFTPEEASEIKAAATELINDAVAERVDELRTIKETLQTEFEASKRKFAKDSEARAQRETERLMSKIDAISDKFLSENEALRRSTKLASQADQGMEGKGLELGSWGVVRGGNVVMDKSTAGGGGGAGGLLGSVDSATKVGKEKKPQDKEGTTTTTTAVAPSEDRVLIIVDEGQDPSAKKILNEFTTLLNEAFDSKIQIDSIKPTSIIPLGGNNAQCVILFATSINDGTSAKNILNRLLKRTITSGTGQYGTPPSHLVCVSTIGTERTNKFPYNMQNLMGGGTLDKRRDVEEVVINTVKSRLVGVQAPLDYTIVKFGTPVVVVADSADNTKVKKDAVVLSIMPGDQLDGDLTARAAANVLLQAIAYQPFARNATFCAVGGMKLTREGKEQIMEEEVWDDLFLRLDGPELLRINDLAKNTENVDMKYEQLSEYIKGWSQMFEGEAKGTGLTTPVTVSLSQRLPNPELEGVVRRSGVRIVFKPTRTGSAYKSREEERAMERDRKTPTTSQSSSGTEQVVSRRKAKKEGGVEVLVEKTTKGELRVRVRRCNMGDDTVLKELSEEAILKRLEEGINSWRKGHE